MFKKGDKVERWQGGSNAGMQVGDTGVVISVGSDGNPIVRCDRNGEEGEHDKNNVRLIQSTNPKNMNVIEKFALAMKGEPEKSFIKAGIMNTNETLTDDGTKVFMAYLLKKHKDDFKKEVVDPILAEESKN